MIYTETDVLYMVYSFYGGTYDGQQFHREFMEGIKDGLTADNTLKRAMGCLCPRKELDNQPKVDGYYGPMWDGIRCVMNDGSVKYDFQVLDKTQVVYSFGVLRYETEEIYEAMSN